MTARVEPVDLRERIAVAANTSNLGDDSLAAHVAGAMGAAAMMMETNAGGHRQARLTAAATAQIHPRRQLAALIERAKYGGDRSVRHEIVIKLAHVLAKSRIFTRHKGKSRSPQLFAFAGLVVAEWLHPNCPQCGGGGFVALGKSVGRNTLTTICGVCKGTGHASTDHAARAIALGVRMETYTAHWQPRFDEAMALLGDIEAGFLAPLQAQLRRGTLHPVSDVSRIPARAT